MLGLVAAKRPDSIVASPCVYRERIGSKSIRVQIDVAKLPFANLLPSRMPWTRKFPKPIKLKDGRKIATLGQARELMLALPERHQSRPFWQYAAELLIEAAEHNGDVDDAAAQLSRALAAEGLLLMIGPRVQAQDDRVLKFTD
jgi:hypothetical protein